MPIPKSIIAGDTLAFTDTNSDYPASVGWVKTFVLINATAKYSFSSTAQGDSFSFNVAASTTSAWAVGDYSYQATVVNGSQKFTIETGQFTVKPSFASQTTFDNRSSAVKILSNLMTAYESASLNQAFVQRYEIAGRMMIFNQKADWITEINFWKREVAKEKAKEKLAEGLGGRPRMQVRF